MCSVGEVVEDAEGVESELKAETRSVMNVVYGCGWVGVGRDGRKMSLEEGRDVDFLGLRVWYLWMRVADTSIVVCVVRRGRVYVAI